MGYSTVQLGLCYVFHNAYRRNFSDLHDLKIDLELGHDM
jgi:hypothetical protein